MSQWRVLDLLNFDGEVTASQGHIYIGDKSIGLIDVATILTGPRVKLTGSLIDRACAFSVTVLPCDWRGIPLTAINPWSTHSSVGKRHRAQASLSEPRQKNAWMHIVKSKIQGQSANLDSHSAVRFRLDNIRKSVRSGDPSNCEAQAARFYWSDLFLGEKFNRDRTAGDSRNALLNYGYTILRGLVIRHTVASGLWPTLGVWHRNRANTFALADDWLVRSLPPGTSLKDPGTRQHLVGVSNIKFGQSTFTLSTEIEKTCQRFGQYVEGDFDTFVVDSWALPTDEHG
jgi:CRISPR-associated protein Cas1